MRRFPARTSSLLLLAPSLTLAPPVAAHGGLSSLGALQALFYFVVAGYLLLWLVAGIVVFFVTRRRRRAEGRPWFLFDAARPAGIRALVLWQYLAAFVYGNVAVLRLVFPGDVQHYAVDRDWAGWDTACCVIVTVLAVLSANGYLARSPGHGFRLGLAFGWFCVLNAGLYLVAHGPYPGLEPAAFLVGAPAIVLLHWRYRGWFGLGPPGSGYRIAAGAMRWAAMGTGAVVGLYLAGSLLVTTVFPPDEDEAREVLTGVAEAMRGYHAETGRWPMTLDELDAGVGRRYRLSEVQYSPQELELWLSVRIPIEPPDMAYRLSYGFQGRTGHIDRIGQRLQP